VDSLASLEDCAEKEQLAANPVVARTTIVQPANLVVQLVHLTEVNLTEIASGQAQPQAVPPEPCQNLYLKAFCERPELVETVAALERQRCPGYRAADPTRRP
jgi:hypothetical protein